MGTSNRNYTSPENLLGLGFGCGCVGWVAEGPAKRRQAAGGVSGERLPTHRTIVHLNLPKPTQAFPCALSTFFYASHVSFLLNPRRKTLCVCVCYLPLKITPHPQPGCGVPAFFVRAFRGSTGLSVWGLLCTLTLNVVSLGFELQGMGNS